MKHKVTDSISASLMIPLLKSSGSIAVSRGRAREAPFGRQRGTYRRIPHYLCALLVTVWAGCSSPSAPPAPERFGDPYEILTNLSPHSPDEPPAIVSDSLSALVAYAGGCAEHAFEPHARVTGRAAAILLRHDNGGDTCEAWLHDRIVVPLPANILESPEIHLLHPQGAAPFILRWSPAEE